MASRANRCAVWAILLAVCQAAAFVPLSEAGPARYDPASKSFSMTYTFRELKPGRFGDAALGEPQRATADQDAAARVLISSSSEVLQSITQGRGRIGRLEYTEEAERADFVISLTGESRVVSWAVSGAIEDRPGFIGIYLRSIQDRQSLSDREASLQLAHEICHYFFGLADEYVGHFYEGCPRGPGPGCLMGNFYSSGRGWYGRLCTSDDHNIQPEQMKSCQELVDQFFAARSAPAPVAFQAPVARVQSGSAANDIRLDKKLLDVFAISLQTFICSQPRDWNLVQKVVALRKYAREGYLELLERPTSEPMTDGELKYLDELVTAVASDNVSGKSCDEPRITEGGASSGGATGGRRGSGVLPWALGGVLAATAVGVGVALGVYHRRRRLWPGESRSAGPAADGPASPTTSPPLVPPVPGRPPQAVEVFISYAHEDRDYRDRLEAQLSVLKYFGKNPIQTWQDQRLGAGVEWDQEIRRRLDNSAVIVLLVSADFLNSKYIRDVEIKRAIEMYESGKGVIRSCLWQETPVARFQALPKDEDGTVRPIASWPDRDEAFHQVVESIRDAIVRLQGASR